MKTFFISLILIIIGVVAFGVFSYYKLGDPLGLGKTIFSKDKINISSQAFLNGGAIPQNYTCDGENINPPLSIDRVPGNARSLALIVEDVDTANSFTHWLVFNIDPTVTDIVAGQIPNALEGTNDFGELKYQGPCPTPGSSHRYYFRVYALDTVLNLEEGTKKSDLENAMKGHILATGSIYGTYAKPL